MLFAFDAVVGTACTPAALSSGGARLQEAPEPGTIPANLRCLTITGSPSSRAFCSGSNFASHAPSLSSRRVISSTRSKHVEETRATMKAILAHVRDASN